MDAARIPQIRLFIVKSLLRKEGRKIRETSHPASLYSPGIDPL